MPPADFTAEFIKKLDSGEFDGRFSEEVRKLSKEQLEELASILVERNEKRARLS